MPAGDTDIAALRREIMDLLRQQIEALDSPQGLTDSRLTECYARQARVQELREQLQAATSSHPEVVSTACNASTVAEPSSCEPQATLASVDAPASI
jgi:crotonobetainyl-CoA:carnitine CoA-transferase CaiB-like acyl-CoA transferase